MTAPRSEHEAPARGGCWAHFVACGSWIVDNLPVLQARDANIKQPSNTEWIKYEMESVFMNSFEHHHELRNASPFTPITGVSRRDRFRDLGGLSPIITVGAHPRGANPKRWRACDMFSPTVVVDPTRLTKGFGLGMNFSFKPWFGDLFNAIIGKTKKK